MLKNTAKEYIPLEINEMPTYRLIIVYIIQKKIKYIDTNTNIYIYTIVKYKYRKISHVKISCEITRIRIIKKKENNGCVKRKQL